MNLANLENLPIPIEGSESSKILITFTRIQEICEPNLYQLIQLKST